MAELDGPVSCRHCEERSDEAIQNGAAVMDCFAPLAMTGEIDGDMLYSVIAPPPSTYQAVPTT